MGAIPAVSKNTLEIMCAFAVGIGTFSIHQPREGIYSLLLDNEFPEPTNSVTHNVLFIKIALNAFRVVGRLASSVQLLVIVYPYFESFN